MEKIISYNEAFQIASNAGKKTIIFRSGCFDMLHVGHIMMLENAKSIADILMVGIGSDTTVKKDRDNTYFDEDNRALLVASISCVDYVIVLKEEANGNVDHANFLESVLPHFYYISAQDKQLADKKALATKLGIRAIVHDEMKVSNHGKIIQPHSSILKQMWL